MIAYYNGHMKVVTYLIERGANIDLQDNRGNKALHKAIDKDHFKIAKELVALGASQLPNIPFLTPVLLASSERLTKWGIFKKRARKYKGTEN